MASIKEAIKETCHKPGEKIVLYPQKEMVIDGIECIYLHELHKADDGTDVLYDFWGREISVERIVDNLEKSKGTWGSYYSASDQHYTFVKVLEDGTLDDLPTVHHVDNAEAEFGNFAGYVYYNPEAGPFVSFLKLFSLDDSSYDSFTDDILSDVDQPYGVRFFAKE